ncbi:acyltransferase [Marinimicrobium sp. ARAG 43.8]|uniref:acyltransferase n=1 Tax=Marinimicrobium sp. ARAG 43.8 TaxID=3418719 RepID=UPI003CEB6892
MTERVRFFDLLRCLAAVAVIAIHVLAPYRDLLGSIPFSEWLTATTINGISRWAVPVFILVTGALLVSDPRPFNPQYYVKRRLAKVLLPFIVWSLFYAWFSGWTAMGYDAESAKHALMDSPHHATYYHLGFFYYFIPLYFIAPLFQWLARNDYDPVLYIYLALWLTTSALYLFYVDGPWEFNLWLFSGYLPLGYVLYKKVPINAWSVGLFTLAGIAALVTTVAAVTLLCLDSGDYSFKRWLSYKTLNVIFAASMIFVLCRALADKLSERAYRVVQFISRYSLGIYILHPIFLWPMKTFGWHGGHPAWVIPLWVLLSGGGALALSWQLSRSAKTRWLLP